jgi:predicted Zn-ribbon and HTH transcriptional regulator
MSVVRMIRREQSKHPMKPAGCNGWWSERERALLHGAARCPVCDPEVQS